MTDPTSEVVESEETILEEIALTLQSLSTEELLRRIVAYFSGDEVSTERALAILHAAQASRRYTLPEDPAFAVTPYLLAGIGIPQKAVGWLADKHGWIEGEDGWGNVFLPLQTKALLEGICDPKRLLFQSGVIAASTSAGKTLLAELRFLTRHFLTEPDTPKKTVMLVPTREIGMERVAALREAYGTNDREKKLDIYYSDGENHGRDVAIRDGRFDVAVIVNEKLRWFARNPTFWEVVGELVIDEMDLMGEGERGAYLELAMTSALRAQPGLSVLGLCTPCRGAERVMSALKHAGRETFFLEGTRRPVDINVGIWSPQTQKAAYLNCNSGEETLEPLSLPYPGDIKGTLKGLLRHYTERTTKERSRGLRNNLVIAVPTKRDNVNFATLLAHLYETDSDVRAILDENRQTEFIEERLRSLEPTLRKSALGKLMRLGIGFHDRDLSPFERTVVSQAFREGELAVLFCTSTMAQGINLPAQTIAFVGWSGRPYSPSQCDPLPPFFYTLEADFTAWLGRVGRYGKRIHRTATALYLSIGGSGSDEYERMSRLIEKDSGREIGRLAKSGSLEAALLAAIMSVRQKTGEAAFFSEVLEYLRATPTAMEENDSDRLQSRSLEEMADLGDFRLLDAHSQLSSFTQEERHHVETEEFLAAVEQAQEVLPMVRSDLKLQLDLAKEDGLRFLLGVGGGLDTLRELVADPEFGAHFLVPYDDETRPPLLHIVEREGQKAFEPTRLGRIAFGHGVSKATCQDLHEWVRENALYHPQGWDILDLLHVLSQTPSGKKIPPFRVKQSHYAVIREAYYAHLRDAEARLGPKWKERSPLFEGQPPGLGGMATLLALRDWRRGQPMHIEWKEGEQPDPSIEAIETKYGLHNAGCSLYEMARNFARLLRALTAIAHAMPEGTFTAHVRPEETPPLEQDVVCLPFDTEKLAGEVLYGVPHPAVPLARLGVDGLSRGWVAALYEKLEALQVAPDLPILERVRLLEADSEALKVLPTHGLRQRVREETLNSSRITLPENLRNDFSLVKRFYEHPFVMAAQLAQGKDRYTAMKVCYREAYTVLRRNHSPKNPIALNTEEDFAYWRDRGAVEFLSEIGHGSPEYFVDRLFVDMDPKNGYPLDKLAHLAEVLLERMEAHDWVEQVEVNWTGGKGFHLIGPFKKGVLRPAEQVKGVMAGIVKRLCNDVSIFETDQVTLTDPFVTLDLKPLMRRGLYRNAFSLNATSGNVCIPVERRRLREFRPEREATLSAVMETLDILTDGEGCNYDEDLKRYFEFQNREVINYSA
jgi:hypothetical protein